MDAANKRSPHPVTMDWKKGYGAEARESGPKLRDWILKKQPKFSSCEIWGVLTTIFAPSEAARKFLDLDTTLSKLCLVVVGDAKGPHKYDIGLTTRIPMTFTIVNDQRELSAISPLVRMLPRNHFGRKNIGYVLAIVSGSAKFCARF